MWLTLLSFYQKLSFRVKIDWSQSLSANIYWLNCLSDSLYLSQLWIQFWQKLSLDLLHLYHFYRLEELFSLICYNTYSSIMCSNPEVFAGRMKLLWGIVSFWFLKSCYFRIIFLSINIIYLSWEIFTTSIWEFDGIIGQ